MGGQGGCERRIEVFGKIHTKKYRGGWPGSGWVVGQGECERRIEVFVKIQKIVGGGSGWLGGGGSGWM